MAAKSREGAVDASVIVATRNRATLLPACLDALAAQRTTARYEVVVVDNGSHDATATVVGERARTDPRVRLVQEPVAGLSRAKNAGIAAARADLLLFTDDDVVASERWLAAIVEFLQRADAGRILAGGPVLPVAHDLSPWPPWVGAGTADMPRLYHGPAQRPVGEFEWLWGANMGARRELLEAIGGFDEALGNVGDDRGTFEDVALVQRVQEHGGQCWYLPEAVVHHRTAPAATRPRALMRKAFARGANDVLRSRRGGYVEPAMPVPQGPLAAAPATPALLAAWVLSVVVFRLTGIPRALGVARRLAWGAGWCAAAGTSRSNGAAARILRRATDLALRIAIALAPR